MQANGSFLEPPLWLSLTLTVAGAAQTQEGAATAGKDPARENEQTLTDLGQKLL